MHDLLSCHHRPNGKHIQVPVGDISEVRGEGRLSRPNCRLQYLMDRAVPPEQGSCNLPNFMSPDPQLLKVLLREHRIHKGNDRPQPERHGCCKTNSFFLTLVGTKRSSIPGQYCSIRDRYFLRALMGQSKSSSVTVPKIIHEQDSELIEMKIGHRRILDLSNEVR